MIEDDAKTSPLSSHQQGIESPNDAPPIIDGFTAASEWLELSVGGVALFARGHSPGRNFPTDVCISLLENHQFLREKHSPVLYSVIDEINALSEGRITWEHGRGLSGLTRDGTPNPSIFNDGWLSAHEAALGISSMLLQHFWWPLAQVTTAVEQEALFEKLIIEPRRNALAMTMREVKEWGERIRWERVKYVNLQNRGAVQTTIAKTRSVADYTPRDDEPQVAQRADDSTESEWTEWTRTKVAKKWFPGIESPSGWTDFANGLREKKLMENHPISKAKKVKIHCSVFTTHGLPFPTK